MFTNRYFTTSRSKIIKVNKDKVKIVTEYEMYENGIKSKK